jgi:DNA modification methylase
VLTPYFKDATVTLYHGDCREVLPTLAPESVDLIVCDPPYGVSWESGFRGESFGGIAGDHSTDAAVEATRLALRTLRHGRHVYLFGRYDLANLGLTPPVELIWDKGMTGLGDLASPWGTSHEPIEFRVHSKRPSGIERGNGRLAARLRKGSVLRHQRPNAMGVRHPSEKPAELLCELIESSSCRGDLVLDYFAGVGSTLVAARMEGRQAIGIEIEERYCEIAAKRLAQGTLFGATGVA